MDIPTSLLSSTIKRGDILHSTMFEDIDHGKFFVVIGIHNNIVAGFFYVNSNVNKFIEAKQALFEMQYIIRPSDYDFLKRDSFISAIAIKQITLEDLASSIKTGETRRISELKEEHLQELLELVRGSRLFSPIEKKKFFY